MCSESSLCAVRQEVVKDRRERRSKARGRRNTRERQRAHE